MLFSSMTFIFIFLPLVLTACYLALPKFRNHILLLSSFIFYGWGEPRYLAIMLLTIGVNYVGAIWIEKYKHGRKRSFALTVTIMADLAFLIYFKYFNFICENINAAFAMDMKFLDVIMPLGISFYTFQAMSYLVDVYRKEVRAQRNLYTLSLYISMFPQLVAGPIVKYQDIYKQFTQREENPYDIIKGSKRFVIGLVKKVLIANTLGAVADKIFALPADQFDTFTAWVGAIAYTLQIYYDFSGYSDMAIGLCLILGFKIPENFNFPYISKSITEFWRRWHISLSSWFKQYLYIPLGGNKVSRRRNIFNLFLVFLITGIWHGASWVFIAWGLWHGAFVIFEKITGLCNETQAKLVNAFKHCYAILVFVIGWVIFRSDTLAYACSYVQNMFGLIGEHNLVHERMYYVNNFELIAFVIGIMFAMPLGKRLFRLSGRHIWFRFLMDIALLALFILAVASIAASTYNPFIYFRF